MFLLNVTLFLTLEKPGGYCFFFFFTYLLTTVFICKLLYCFVCHILPWLWGQYVLSAKKVKI